MWKPDERLDDYLETPAAEVNSVAPPSVSLRRTGEVEVLTPLTRVESRTTSRRYALRVPFQPLWFRRFLAVGSGALVMIAFVLVSAILVGINDPSGETEVATIERLDEPVTQPEESFSLSSFAPNASGVDIARANARRRPVRPTIQLAANKSRRRLRPPLQPEEPNFVPTTLVIYAENGLINTRIEPWFQAGDKKTTTFNN